MKKYLSLYAAFFKTSVMADLEYRLNVVARVFTDIIWYLVQASVFEVLFHHAPHISGWDITQARVFMATLFVMDAFWMVLFQENFDRLSTKVRKGEMDLILAKPVDGQFMLTLQKQNTSYIINIVITLVYLFWTAQKLTPPVGGLQFLLLLLVGLPMSLSIMYCFRMLFACMTIVFTNADNLTYVWYQIYKLGMRPDPLYPRWLRYIVLSFLPVGFVASVPARILIGTAESAIVAWGLVVTIGLHALTRWAWKRSLVHYSSASS